MPSIFITPAGIAGGLTSTTNLDIFANGAKPDTVVTAGVIQLRSRVVFPDTYNITTGTLQNLISFASTVNVSASPGGITGFAFSPTFAFSVSQTFTTCPAFSAVPVYKPTITGISDTLTTYAAFNAAPAYQLGFLSGSATTPLLIGFTSIINASRTDAASTATGTIARAIHFLANVDTVFVPDAVKAGITVTLFGGLYVANMSAITGTITEYLGVDIEGLSRGTSNIAFRSAIAAGATNYFLRDTGGAQCSFAGKFTTYNNIATLGFGVPPILDVITTQTGKTTNITATAFANASTAGLYRIEYYLEVTTTAAVPTITATIAYTDDGTARTVISATVAFVTNSATAGFTQGTVFVRLASGSITYATTITGAIGTGVYSFYASCERIS